MSKEALKFTQRFRPPFLRNVNTREYLDINTTALMLNSLDGDLGSTNLSHVDMDNGLVDGCDVIEPIAIIGFSFEFPQNITSPHTLWQALAQKRSTMTEFPTDRLNVDGFYDSTTDNLNRFPHRGGNFLEGDIATFDAPFFSISPTEAREMDPLQRGLLEASYQALENAGIPLQDVIGSNTSIFASSFADGYKTLRRRDPETMGHYAASGTEPSMLANRISWYYDFRGTSVNLDTACSSSLVAMHFACQGLRDKQSDMALVGGCNLIFDPDSTIALSNQKFLSPDSKCFSFDYRANGFARGEGFAVLVLKRLDDAISNGDTIRAVIRGTGSNQDGRTPGITQPSKDAQEQLIHNTYRTAGLDGKLTRYFEAHGTGTPVGDPIETAALGAFFSQYRNSADPMYCGSIKANIGHLEGGSGIAGIVKSILVLEKGVIPPNANFERPNPNIDATKLNLKFPMDITPWPTKGPRRISVNSFGFGGTNAHAILDDAFHYLHIRGITGNHNTCIEVPTNEAAQDLKSPVLQMTACDNDIHRLNHSENGQIVKQKTPTLLIFSAMDEGGLDRLLTRYRAHFSSLTYSNTDGWENGYLSLLSYTLNERRSALLWRSYVVIDSITDLESEAKLKLTKPVPGSTKRSHGPKLALCFSGQGAQWFAMGRELIYRYSAFKKCLVSLDLYLKELGCSWSIIDELCLDEEHTNVNDSAFSQPLCTAIQIALVDLLWSVQIYPVFVVGHSSGEIASAYCAGALDRESAIKVAYYRGLLTSRISKNGKFGMLAVGLSDKLTQKYLDQVNTNCGDNNTVSIGCINSPKSVTISGRVDQIVKVQRLLEGNHIFARKIVVDVPYHSTFLESIATEYESLMGQLSSSRDEVSKRPIMVSSVTTKQVNIQKLREAHYWVENLISTVRFSEALTNALILPDSGPVCNSSDKKANFCQIDYLLEVGPHSALKSSILEILSDNKLHNYVEYGSILTRYRPADRTFLETLGHLHCRGHSIHYPSIRTHDLNSKCSPTMLTDLPKYPFDHLHAYWKEGRMSKGYRFRKEPQNSFLGIPVPDWTPLDGKWRRTITLDDGDWLKDHKIHGIVIYPAAAMLVMALEAARQVSQLDKGRKVAGYSIKDVSIYRSLSLTGAGGVEVEFHLRTLRQSSDKEHDWSEFRLCSLENQEWVENCSGRINVEFEDNTLVEVDEGRESREHIEHCQKILRDAEVRCTGCGTAEQMYEKLNQIGVSFGPAFQTVHKVSCSDLGETVARVGLSRWRTPVQGEYPTVIHPTALDGFLHLPLASLSRGGQQHIPSFVATYIRKLWIRSAGLTGLDLSEVKTYTKSESRGFREIESSVIGFDESENNLLITIDGYTMMEVGNQTSQITSSPRLLCFNINQRPDVDLLSQETFRAYSNTVYKPFPSPLEFHRELKLCMMWFIHKALDTILPGDINKLQSHHTQYLRWMNLERQKFDSGKQDTLYVDWKKFADNQEHQNLACYRLAKQNATGKFYIEVGKNLTKILQGEVDALDLFFRTTLVKDHYDEFYQTTNGLNSFLVYLDALAHKCPGMKILEIGAGTGAVSRLILQTLTNQNRDRTTAPRFSHYTYTDISPSFFENAKSMFENFESKVTFKILDIEKSPQQQGFELGTYDLIIADNVLHATQDLDTSLSNTRKLLRSGGKIALFELTEPEALRANFAYGLLPGWWRATDQYRDMSAGVSEKVWTEVLVKAGFSGVELSLPDYYDQECHEHSVLVSTAIESPAQENFNQASRHLKEILIIADERSSSQQSFALQLREGFKKLNAITTISNLENTPTLARNTGNAFLVILLEIDDPILAQLDTREFELIRDLITTSSGIIWITRDRTKLKSVPRHAILNGVARSVRQENEKLKFVTITFEHETPIGVSATESILRVYGNTIDKADDEYEPEYVMRDGIMSIDRFIEAKYMNEKLVANQSDQHSSITRFSDGLPLALTISAPGLLDTLQFIEDKTTNTPLASDEVEIEVHVGGVNFVDCLTALGRLPETLFGCECAGLVRRIGTNCGSVRQGDRVCAYTAGTYQTYARCKSSHVIPLPDNVSFLEGAALPVAFSTACYALQYIARIREGESILIHSAAGGTGQAAIQIAQLSKANIFATVGSNEKRQLLIDLYAIPKSQIFCSRNGTFAGALKRMLKERGGVDIVLNSLSGSALIDTWECMAPFGRFLEIGKKDILNHGYLPMFPFAKNVSFHAIDLNTARKHRPSLLSELKDTISTLLVGGKIRPSQPLHVYGIGEVEKAFRYLQSGRNTGKTVVEMRSNDMVKTVLDIKPEWFFDDSSAYLIAGGLGGIGRSVARWMVQRGAKHLILLSRFGPRLDTHTELICELRGDGVEVETPACDISDKHALNQVLGDLLQKMPPLKGCIQSSMLLKDSIFEQMTHEQWVESLAPKVQAGAVGSTAQANYAAGCAFQDALAHYRVSMGEKSTTLNLGPMIDEGMLSENHKMKDRYTRLGYLTGTTNRDLNTFLDHYCNPAQSLSPPLTTQLVVGIDIPASLQKRDVQAPTFMRRPQLRLLYNMGWDEVGTKIENEISGEIGIEQQLKSVTSFDEAVNIISDSLMKKVSKSLATPLENFDSSRSMHTYGVDSLVAVELRNWFSQTIDADVAIFEILGKASFDQVGALAAGKSRVVQNLLAQN